MSEDMEARAYADLHLWVWLLLINIVAMVSLVEMLRDSDKSTPTDDSPAFLPSVICSCPAAPERDPSWAV